MQERLRRRLEAELDAELAGEGLKGALEREEVGRLSPAPPRLLNQRPDGEGGQPVRLGKGRRALTGEDPRQRPVADGVESDAVRWFRPADALGERR